MSVFIKMKTMIYFINFYIDSHFAMIESSCNGNRSNGKAFKFCSVEQKSRHLPAWPALLFFLARALIHKTLYKYVI